MPPRGAIAGEAVTAVRLPAIAAAATAGYSFFSGRGANRTAPLTAPRFKTTRTDTLSKELYVFQL